MKLTYWKKIRIHITEFWLEYEESASLSFKRMKDLSKEMEISCLH